MENRKCYVHVTIDTGKVSRCYRCKLLAEFPAPFIGGFSLQAKEQARPYHVLLAVDGVANCTCDGWQHTEKCKHVDALTAADLFSASIIRALKERTEQLHQAEAEVKKVVGQAIEEQMIYQEDMRQAQERIDDLAVSVKNLAERCLQLQTALVAVPPRRTRKAKVAA